MAHELDEKSLSNQLFQIEWEDRTSLQEMPEHGRKLDFDELVIDIQTTMRFWRKQWEKNSFLGLSVLKSEEEATRIATLANEADKKEGEEHKAIEMYTECIALAPDKSKTLAIAYDNRSASLFRIGKFIECVLDVNRALEGNCPKNIRAKLEKRKQECLNKMRASNQQSIADYLENQTEPKMRATYSVVDVLLDSMCEFGNPSIPQAYSSQIKLELDQQRGRRFVATEDIEPGQIISRKEFFLTAVHPSALYQNCSYCLVRCYALIPCPSCTEMYCSKKCLSEASEKYHEMECKMFRMNGEPYHKDLPAIDLFKAVRALLIGTKQGTELRSLMAQLNIDHVFAENTDPFNSQFVEDYLVLLRTRRTYTRPTALSNMRAVKTTLQARAAGFFDKYTTSTKNDQDAISEDALNTVELFVAMLLQNHMSTFSATYAFEITQLTGCFTLNSGYQKSVGFGVNVLHNFVDHSCDPNVQCTMVKNREQILYARRPIKKGEQILLSYDVDFLKLSLEERRLKLRRYSINCQCEACSNNWPSSEILLPNSFLNKPLAIADFNKQILQNKFNGGVTDLPSNEILQSAVKLVKWTSMHVKRPSPLFMICETLLDIFMKLMFEESSRQEYIMNTSEICTLFHEVVECILIFIDESY